jgi:hypothetical protein
MYVLQAVQCISGLRIVVFYVTDVFAVPKCQVSTGLAYVRAVASFTCHLHLSHFQSQKDNNFFKQTDIKIAFKSTNTLQQLTKPKTHDTTQNHDKSGIYKITPNKIRKINVNFTRRNSRQVSVRRRNTINIDYQTKWKFIRMTNSNARPTNIAAE